MDYKELIEQLNAGEFDRDYECTPFECGAFALMQKSAEAITDLLSRVEATENERDSVRATLRHILMYGLKEE